MDANGDGAITEDEMTNMRERMGERMADRRRMGGMQGQDGPMAGHGRGGDGDCGMRGGHGGGRMPWMNGDDN